MGAKDHKDLKIWQRADLIFDMICEDIKKWPNNRVANAIAYQVINSGGSISANIAEGYGRGIPGEFEQFLRYSRGSAAESDNWLFKAKKLKLISEKRYNEYRALFEEENKMIGSFIHRLRTQSRKKPVKPLSN
jgi:four helix bundle protein